MDGNKFTEDNVDEAVEYIRKAEIFKDIQQLPCDDECWAASDQEDGSVDFIYLETLLDMANDHHKEFEEDADNQRT